MASLPPSIENHLPFTPLLATLASSQRSAQSIWAIHRDRLQAERFRACQTLVLVSASLQKSPSVVDVRVNEQRVHRRVHVLNGDLETVEAASLRRLHFVADVHGQVFVHDAVARREEASTCLMKKRCCLSDSPSHWGRAPVPAPRPSRTRPPPSCTSVTRRVPGSETARTGSGSPRGTAPAASRR
ncbi:unnamed protein product [Phytophthora fragariaefolia]|uniref:Unnamed protein product n=1 Tax=Phytophthora fragariaefolia TaxID=1490495 RepID=A0A9W7CWD6_9STRA|nr:unnamed protein product [Phytophthora fragariaefolia]